MTIDFFDFLLSSGWVVDVWNCRGVLKPRKFAGYGNTDEEILRALGEDYEWLECGNYVIPIRKHIREAAEKAGLLDELRKKVERVLDWIVDRKGGAINISGFYEVTTPELEAVEKSIMRIYWRCLREQLQSPLGWLHEG